jgi:pyridoxal phosphate enzyme (YggS family)
MAFHKSIDNLVSIEDTLNVKILKAHKPKIIAVSKTFPIEDIDPLINHGHIHYGENKVQEALAKWTSIKQKFNHIKLHMIGNLQTNKVKYVIPLFDYIHTLDNIKLAEKIANEQVKKNCRPKIFIQVNIGNESQKNGISLENLKNFYKNCSKDLGLDIIGLMCIPPKNKTSKNYFLEMDKINQDLNLLDLSMGMSQDYLEAAENNATFVRIGSKIFGARS